MPKNSFFIRYLESNNSFSNMLQIKVFTFNPFYENTYILYDETGKAVIVDPGCYEREEREELMDFVRAEHLQVTDLVNTHCHIDHVLGNEFVKTTFKVPLSIHQKEVSVLKSVQAYAPSYGFAGYQASEPDQFLEDGKFLQVGNERLKILFVPGHSPGHVVFYHEESKTCIAGDTLFQGSIGRTDLPGGDHATLLNAIKSVMFTLPEDTIVFPGHGPETSIGVEKEHNPFVGKRAGYR
jgi:hydroxyacylglutathione hydrolase